MVLEERLAELARQLVERERDHSTDLDRAFEYANKVHTRLASALEGFHALTLSEAPQLRIELSEPSVDEKHLHAVQFDLSRGRHRAIFTIKSRGEITMVGPFRSGKTEGPCRSFPVTAETEIENALEELVLSFIQEAVRP